MFFFNLFYRLPVGLDYGFLFEIGEAFGFSSSLHLRVLTHVLRLDRAFNDRWVSVVHNSDKGGCIYLGLNIFRNDLFGGTLHFLFSFFTLSDFLFLGFWPGKSDPSLPTSKFLVLTLNGGILFIDAFAFGNC